MRASPLLLALLLLAPAVAAQDQRAAERRLTSLRGQIEAVERQIAEARRDESGALAAVEGFDTEIALREQLVSGYRTGLDTMRQETQALRSTIGRLEGEIDEARASYRRLAVHAYKHGRANDLALLLSAGSVNQALVRARYLRRFAERRQRQVERIAVKTDELRLRGTELDETVRGTQRLLTASRMEQETLAARRREREGFVADTRRRRGELESDLSQRQADARRLEGAVRELIAAQARQREEERARETERQRVLEAERADARRRAEADTRAREAERAARLSTTRRTRPTPRSEANPDPAPDPTPAPPPVAEATPEPRAEAPPPSSPAEDRFEAITGSFRQNRGRLPWPADGTVTGPFGTRTDPVYNTRVTSIGVDIRTAPGEPVRAVFEGTVNRVASMSTYGTMVWVSHGEYITIYGNLSAVNVAQGQQIRAGQVVGRAGTTEDRRGAALFFALFDGENPVDPLGWLRGR